MDTVQNRGEIKTLTGLRGIAALWVFFLHATWGWAGTSYALRVAKLGGSGVTIFFVLSGFILAYVYAEQFCGGRIGYWSFLRARLARVYPLHLFMLLAVSTLAAIGIIGLLPTDDAYTFALNLGLLQAWGFTDLVSWNQPAWSISTEFFAYLLFPFFIGRMSKLPMPLILICALGVVYWIKKTPYLYVIAWLERIGVMNPAGHQFAHGASLMQFQGPFLAGCVLFFVIERAKSLRISSIWHDFMTISAIGVVLFWCRTATGDLVFWQMCLAAAVLVAGLSNPAKFGRLIFGNAPVVFLGRISYALYLSAIIVDITVTHFLGHPIPLWAELAMAVAAATGLHLLIEVPTRKFINGFGKKALVPTQSTPLLPYSSS